MKLHMQIVIKKPSSSLLERDAIFMHDCVCVSWDVADRIDLHIQSQHKIYIQLSSPWWSFLLMQVGHKWCTGFFQRAREFGPRVPSCRTWGFLLVSTCTCALSRPLSNRSQPQTQFIIWSKGEEENHWINSMQNITLYDISHTVVPRQTVALLPR